MNCITGLRLGILGRRRVRAGVAIAASLAVVVGIAGCSGTKDASENATPTTAPGNPTTGDITWFSNAITHGVDNPQGILIDAFNKKYPNIHIKVVAATPNGDTNRANLTSQISSGGGPDLYMADGTWPAQFAAHGLGVSLSKYLPKSYWSQFADGLVDSASYKGESYGIPLYTDQGLLYYRKDLLEANHLSVPKTWEELVEDSKKVQATGQVKNGYVFQGANYEGATCVFTELLADAGGKVLNSSGAKSELDGPATVKAMTFLSDLVKDGVSPAAESTFHENEALNVFNAGDALFQRSWSYAYAAAQGTGSAVVGKVGVAPMPTFEGQDAPGYSTIGGYDLMVNPHSKNIAASLTFAKWLTSTEAQKIFATQFSVVPVTNSVRNDAEVRKSNPVLETISNVKLVARPSSTPEYSKVSNAIFTAVTGVVSGSDTPKDAAKQANEQVASAIGKNGGL